MNLGQRLSVAESQKRPVTTTIALRPSRPCQFRDLFEGEKFFSGPYLLCKLDWHRASELAVDDALVWEGIDPNAVVYRAQICEGTRRPARAELPRESWCQPTQRRA